MIMLIVLGAISFILLFAVQRKRSIHQDKLEKSAENEII
jgi:hypothetical protein